LSTETVVEDDNEIIYILIDEDVEKEVKNGIVKESNNEPYSLRKENERLKKEIQRLKEEIASLKKRV
jgi:flagellar motility protein MotE (MotC chaperone)